ncbi:MAG: hypothetical protein KR126chlam1_01119 [Chlamydiae bacterium]|nr:hypothetical protein [Chlamydiota bacterium]
MKRLFVALLCLISTSVSASPKYYLSICAIFRNEDRFLKEWIEYHRMMGAEHFYLFNHLSEDNYLEVLKPYVQEGIVDLIEWPFEPKSELDWQKNIQGAAYNKILNENGNDNVWIAFIDTDEFITLSFEKSLPLFLSEFEEFGGIVMNWQLFGTSNVKRIPDDRTLIGTLTRKAPFNHELNLYIKSIVQSRAVSKFVSVHHPRYHTPFFPVNEHKVHLNPHETSPYLSIDNIRLNHYYYRDEDFFTEVKVPRLSKNRGAISPMPNPEYNETEDLIMLTHVPELERRLFSQGSAH